LFSEDDSISEEEIAELALLDDLLAKAQKARDVPAVVCIFMIELWICPL
jgi:hypothetical protein